MTTDAAITILNLSIINKLKSNLDKSDLIYDYRRRGVRENSFTHTALRF